MLRYAALLASLLPWSASGENHAPDDLPQPVKFDILVKTTPEATCEPSDGGEIVVCATPAEDQEQYRLGPHKGQAKLSEKPLEAKVALGENTALSAEADSASLDRGRQSKRLMVRLKIKF